MECDREFFIILERFLPFYPTNNLKSQNFEKLKKRPGDIIILHKSSKNDDHMLHCSLDMMCNKFNCYFSFWAIFYPFTSLTGCSKIWNTRMATNGTQNNKSEIWNTEQIIQNDKTQNSISGTGKIVKHKTRWTWKHKVYL